MEAEGCLVELGDLEDDCPKYDSLAPVTDEVLSGVGGRGVGGDESTTCELDPDT